jgi:hypothetical protein
VEPNSLNGCTKCTAGLFLGLQVITEGDYLGLAVLEAWAFHSCFVPGRAR